MSEHTPGPWKVHEHTEFGPVEGHPEHGMPDSDVFSEGDEYSRTVAHAKRFYKDNKRDLETQRANARLIAAAPELLKACEWMAGLIEESDGVAGFHLNGDVAGWDEFPFEVAELVDAIKNATE